MTRQKTAAAILAEFKTLEKFMEKELRGETDTDHELLADAAAAVITYDEKVAKLHAKNTRECVSTVNARRAAAHCTLNARPSAWPSMRNGYRRCTTRS